MRLTCFFSENCYYFDLNNLKFEFQYEWTPPQIFFGGYRVLQHFDTM